MIEQKKQSDILYTEQFSCWSDPKSIANNIALTMTRCNCSVTVNIVLGNLSSTVALGQSKCFQLESVILLKKKKYVYSLNFYSIVSYIRNTDTNHFNPVESKIHNSKFGITLKFA